MSCLLYKNIEMISKKSFNSDLGSRKSESRQ